MLDRRQPDGRRVERAARRARGRAAPRCDSAELLDAWPAVVEAYAGDEYVVHDPRQGDPHRADPRRRCRARRSARSRCRAYEDHGELLRWLRCENVPGQLPLHRRRVRVQARGRGPDADVRRRRRRVPHQPALQAALRGQPAKRLSTAFDSVTLYGNDPDQRPDIYGKVGNSGVSIATLDDMKVLYDGFDLCAQRRRCR